MTISLSHELTLKEACKRLGCSRETFVRWATEGFEGKRLGAFRRGRRWYITQQAIEDFKIYPEAPPETPTRRQIDQQKIREQLRVRFRI